MAIFQPLTSNQSHLGIPVLLLRCQREITEEIFKMIFPLLLLITIIKTQKMWDSHKHIPFHFFVISNSIYILTTKIKAHEEIQCIGLEITQKNH